MTFSKSESKEAQDELKALLDEFETKTVFVVQRNVSRSGMRRYIDLYLISNNPYHIDGDGQMRPRRITYLVAKALRWIYNEKYESMQVDGVGMDMHFHAVYSLSATLYGHEDRGGYTLKKETI